jgi:geranylgeranyl pyrophosphate synthase
MLRDTLATKTSDQAEITRVIDLLEECGATESCSVEAREMVEGGWKRLEPLIDDSLAKMMLRAFGWFVLERHY